MASVLAAIALPCQRLIKICVEPNRPIATPLCIIGIAHSGEGKSALEGIYMSAHRDFEQEKRKQHKEAEREYETDMAVFNADHWALKRQLTKDAEKNGGSRREELKQELFELLETRPKKPQSFRCLFENTTPAALTQSLVANACVAVMAHEGINAIKGGIFSNPGLLNSGYDGTHYHFDRVVSGSFVLPSVLITLFITIQPKTFDMFMDVKGDLLHDIGLINRSFILKPESCIGYRTFTNPENPERIEAILAEFYQRVKELLQRSFPENEEEFPDPIVMVCSPEAQHAWEQYRHQAEFRSRPEAPGRDPNTYLARTPQNVARVAALLAYFFGEETVVSLEWMEQAIAIVTWFADQHKDMFHPVEMPQAEKDAMEMCVWLEGKCREHPEMTRMEVAFVQNRGPLRLRKSHMCRPALQFLVSRGVLKFFKDISTNATDRRRPYHTEYIDLTIFQHVRKFGVFPNNIQPPAHGAEGWVDSALNRSSTGTMGIFHRNDDYGV